MDPALVPRTAPGRQLAWLMNVRTEPSAAQIQDHLEPTAVAQIDVDFVRSQNAGLAAGLLAFGTMVRDLPGAVTRSEDTLLCLELEQGSRVLHGVVEAGGSGRIGLIGLGERPAEAEPDRLRMLYDRVAEDYERLGAQQAFYWGRARVRLQELTHEGGTLLDVGCGPAHLIADLPPSVDVIGTDIAPEMVRLAARARPAGRFAVHDYHDPFPADWPRADVTVALGCLDFCSDLTRVARNLAAATRPGGRLLVTVPRAEPLASREIPLRPLPLVSITVRLRADAEVEAAFGAAGLAVITHETGPGFTAPGIGPIEYGFWELAPAWAEP